MSTICHSIERFAALCFPLDIHFGPVAFSICHEKINIFICWVRQDKLINLVDFFSWCHNIYKKNAIFCHEPELCVKVILLPPHAGSYGNFSRWKSPPFRCKFCTTLSFSMTNYFKTPDDVSSVSQKANQKALSRERTFVSHLPFRIWKLSQLLATPKSSSRSPDGVHEWVYFVPIAQKAHHCYKSFSLYEGARNHFHISSHQLFQNTISFFSSSSALAKALSSCLFLISTARSYLSWSLWCILHLCVNGTG